MRTHFREAWTTLDGRPVFARVSAGGAPGAVPVVCVHGLGVSGRYLMPTARELAADHPTFVPDLPGYGRSAKPPRPLDVPGLAAALGHGGG
jgi:pimeloyl-ACP methyl ester carboxylesterase